MIKKILLGLSLLFMTQGEATYYWNNGCGSNCQSDCGNICSDTCGDECMPYYPMGCGGRTCFRDWPCEFDIGVDFLYWKPCLCDLDVCGERSVEVIETREFITFDYHGICTDWEPAFRVWLDIPDLFSWCHLGFRASYTFIDFEYASTHGPSDDVVPLLLHPILFAREDITAVSCRGEFDASYHEFDALIYFDCCCNGCNSIRPYVGLAGIYLEQDLDSEIFFNTGTVPQEASTDWESELWGIGLRVGIEYKFCYAKCLNFFAFANGTVLASHSDTDSEQLTTVPGEPCLDFNDHDCWCCLPGYHLGVGAEYNFCICDFDIGIRLGYEFLQWFGVPKHRVFFGDNDEAEVGLSVREDRDFGFQGLFAGLVFHF